MINQSKKIKSILIISRCFRPRINGDAVIAEEISKRLAKNYKVTILTTLGKNKAPKYEQSNGVEIYRVGVGRAWPDRYLFSFFVFIRSFSFKFDLVLGAGSYAGLAALLIKIIRNKPYVLREDNGLIKDKLKKYPLTRPIVKIIYRQATAIIAVDTYMKNLVEFAGAPQEKIIVIPNGTNLSLFKPLNINKNPYLIVTVANLEKIKGLDYLIKALPKIINQYSRTELLIIGDGSQRKNLETLTKDLNINNKVKFAGHIDNNQVPKLLNTATIFVGPPVCEEGFGVIFVEAMACGLATIGTKSGGVVDIINDSVSGLLIEKRDSDALANAVIKLLTDHRLREKIIAGGLARSQELDWDKIVVKYEDLFNNLKI